MAGDGAYELNRDEVMAAISRRTRASMNISRTIAAGPHPLPEQRLADLRKIQGVITDEISDLCVVLRGLRPGDPSLVAKLPPGRMDELLGGRTGSSVARPRGRAAPLLGRINIEAMRRACNVALGMPLAASDAGAVVAASHAAATSARGQAAATAAVREELARLRIGQS